MWTTPFDTALSSLRIASVRNFCASSFFWFIDSEACLIVVRRAERTDLFFNWFRFDVLILLIADLRFATICSPHFYYVIIPHDIRRCNISLSDWIAKRKSEKATEYKSERLDIPGNLWVKCFKCSETLFSKDLDKNLKVCPKCGYHFKLSSKERVGQLLDEASFSPYDISMRSTDFLKFFDSQSYEDRLHDYETKTSLMEAVLTGEGTIQGKHVVIGIMDFSFMGGSMGSVVGEKITRAIEKAIGLKLPVIIISTSGGARMQEGIMSLMQMAKTSGALAMLADAGLPYISILTDPTTGGVSASYAMLGDINIAEPGALICFAGPRVIEQTIRQKLPAGFQRAEFLLEHGMVDAVVNRKDLKSTLVKCLDWFGF